MSRGLVQRLGDGATERWDDPARGTLTFRTIFSKGSSPTSGLTVGFAELAPGEHLAPHRHPQAEVYLVVEGEGTIRIEDERLGVTAGTALFMPGGRVHEVVNTSPTSTLRLFYVLDADGIDDVEYEFVGEGTDGDQAASRRPDG